MPCYEFVCEKRKKAFELIMTISEHEKSKVRCPTWQEREGRAAVRRLHNADIEEELSSAVLTVRSCSTSRVTARSDCPCSPQGSPSRRADSRRGHLDRSPLAGAPRDEREIEARHAENEHARAVPEFPHGLLGTGVFHEHHASFALERFTVGLFHVHEDRQPVQEAVARPRISSRRPRAAEGNGVSTRSPSRRLASSAFARTGSRRCCLASRRRCGGSTVFSG